MRIIPVLDLMNGQVVRGVAGKREQYRPITSRLSTSARPQDVARAVRDRLGLSELYLADLDAIGGAEPAWSVYAELQHSGHGLLVDAGVQETAQADSLRQAGIETVVVGLETLPGPRVLEEILDSLGPEACVFSLDLRQGVPLGELAGWKQPDASGVACQAMECGVRRMIVLDLARVGVGDGIGTEHLCRQIRSADPRLELIAGGGVRTADDLDRLRRIGLDGVLVASALHDGRIDAEEIRALCRDRDPSRPLP